MFRYMPLMLLGVVGAVFLLDGVIPVFVKSLFYSVSLSTKSLIVFLLPALIFMLMFKTLSQLGGRGTKLLLFLLGLVVCSNFLSTMLSYQVGRAVYGIDLSLAHPQAAGEGLAPLWTFVLPKWIGNDIAIFAGAGTGLLFALLSPRWGARIARQCERVVEILLKLLIAVIPFFLIGFLMKLVHDRVLERIVRDYALIFSLVALAQFGYIALLYFACSGFKLKGCWAKIKNMLPAGIAGFGSMSSAVAIPLSIAGAEKNVRDAHLARLSIPTTSNIHLIGDCFAIPIFAFAVMKNFGVAEPHFYSYLIFAFYFVMAKFSVAAVPGGGIIVMLPFLEGCLGFTPEMASLITALYILFDPVITCANVFGNGAFAMGAERVRGIFTLTRRKN